MENKNIFEDNFTLNRANSIEDDNNISITSIINQSNGKVIKIIKGGKKEI
jgi:hypothetical protein